MEKKEEVEGTDPGPVIVPKDEVMNSSATDKNQGFCTCQDIDTSGKSSDSAEIIEDLLSEEEPDDQILKVALELKNENFAYNEKEKKDAKPASEILPDYLTLITDKDYEVIIDSFIMVDSEEETESNDISTVGDISTANRCSQKDSSSDEHITEVKLPVVKKSDVVIDAKEDKSDSDYVTGQLAMVEPQVPSSEAKIQFISEGESDRESDDVPKNKSQFSVDESHLKFLRSVDLAFYHTNKYVNKVKTLTELLSEDYIKDFKGHRTIVFVMGDVITWRLFNHLKSLQYLIQCLVPPDSPKYEKTIKDYYSGARPILILSHRYGRETEVNNIMLASHHIINFDMPRRWAFQDFVNSIWIFGKVADRKKLTSFLSNDHNSHLIKQILEILSQPGLDCIKFIHCDTNGGDNCQELNVKRDGFETEEKSNKLAPVISDHPSNKLEENKSTAKAEHNVAAIVPGRANLSQRNHPELAGSMNKRTHRACHDKSDLSSLHVKTDSSELPKKMKRGAPSVRGQLDTLPDYDTLLKLGDEELEDHKQQIAASEPSTVIPTKVENDCMFPDNPSWINPILYSKENVPLVSEVAADCHADDTEQSNLTASEIQLKSDKEGLRIGSDFSELSVPILPKIKSEDLNIQLNNVTVDPSEIKQEERAAEIVGDKVNVTVDPSEIKQEERAAEIVGDKVNVTVDPSEIKQEERAAEIVGDKVNVTVDPSEIKQEERAAEIVGDKVNVTVDPSEIKQEERAAEIVGDKGNKVSEIETHPVQTIRRSSLNTLGIVKKYDTSHSPPEAIEIVLKDCGDGLKLGIKNGTLVVDLSKILETLTNSAMMDKCIGPDVPFNVSTLTSENDFRKTSDASTQSEECEKADLSKMLNASTQSEECEKADLSKMLNASTQSEECEKADLSEMLNASTHLEECEKADLSKMLDAFTQSEDFEQADFPKSLNTPDVGDQFRIKSSVLDVTMIEKEDNAICEEVLEQLVENVEKSCMSSLPLDANMIGDVNADVFDPTTEQLYQFQSDACLKQKENDAICEEVIEFLIKQVDQAPIMTPPSDADMIKDVDKEVIDNKELIDPIIEPLDQSPIVTLPLDADMIKDVDKDLVIDNEELIDPIIEPLDQSPIMTLPLDADKIQSDVEEIIDPLTEELDQSQLDASLKQKENDAICEEVMEFLIKQVDQAPILTPPSDANTINDIDEEVIDPVFEQLDPIIEELDESLPSDADMIQSDFEEIINPLADQLNQSELDTSQKPKENNAICGEIIESLIKQIDQAPIMTPPSDANMIQMDRSITESENLPSSTYEEISEHVACTSASIDRASSPTKPSLNFPYDLFSIDLPSWNNAIEAQLYNVGLKSTKGIPSSISISTLANLIKKRYWEDFNSDTMSCAALEPVKVGDEEDTLGMDSSEKLTKEDSLGLDFSEKLTTPRSNEQKTANASADPSKNSNEPNKMDGPSPSNLGPTVQPSECEKCGQPINNVIKH